MIKLTDSPIPRLAPLAPTIDRSPSGFTTSPFHRFTDLPRWKSKAFLRGSPIHRFTDSPIHLQAGFSLLEVMVAVVILSFGLLAIMHLFPVGLRAGKISQDVTTATFLAQQRIELLKSIKYKDIEIGESSGTFEEPYSEFGEFNWVQNVSEEQEGWLKKVTIKVSWDRYGRTRNIKLTTFLADYQRKPKKKK